MKLLRTVFSILILFSVNSSAQNSDNPETGREIITPLRTINNKAFSLGEKLYFDIHWEIANVGSATLHVADTLLYNGRTVYSVESRAQSNKVISSFYRVDDRANSYIDTEGIYSHRLEKHLKEGGYRADRLFLFDQANKLAVAHRDTLSVPEYCQDILSAFYYVRTQELEIGKTIEVPHFDNGKVYDLVVNVLKKQRVRVPAGTFNCIVVEPKMRGEGLFKHQGRIKIFLTDDEKKIPVLLISKVVFGEVAAKLSKIENEIP